MRGAGGAAGAGEGRVPGVRAGCAGEGGSSKRRPYGAWRGRVLMPSEPNYPVEDVPEVEPCDARAGALQWLGRVLRVAGIQPDDVAACRVRMLQGLAPERYGPMG